MNAVAAMPDGQRILSGSFDKTVRVWLLNGTLESTFERHANGLSALVALPDNQHALSGSGDATVKLFNVNDGAVLRTHAPHKLGDLPGAAHAASASSAARSTARPHRIPRPRAAVNAS